MKLIFFSLNIAWNSSWYYSKRMLCFKKRREWKNHELDISEAELRFRFFFLITYCLIIRRPYYVKITTLRKKCSKYSIINFLCCLSHYFRSNTRSLYPLFFTHLDLAHIFFDDAFEKHEDEEYEYLANRFVKSLVTVVDQAARLDFFLIQLLIIHLFYLSHTFYFYNYSFRTTCRNTKLNFFQTLDH